MKAVLLFCFAFIYCSFAYGQSSGGSTTVLRGRPLDTNMVMYDEQGNALRFYQYEKLLNTGDYTIRFALSGISPQTISTFKSIIRQALIQ